MSLESGRTLSHYRVDRKIGEGGMGEVYVAEDMKLGRSVALKVLSASMATNPDRLARFEREAKALAALNHPHIVTIHSVEEAEGIRFLTMELIEGQSLAYQIPTGGLDLPKVFEIGIALADALAAAHEKGILHRDLKPANVMVSTYGRVKVLDFGLAKLVATSLGTGPTERVTLGESLTETGMVVGTVTYMSPEQVSGQTLDFRTDIFSLGVVLYEMTTGQRPFVGSSTGETISAILRDGPRPVMEARREAPRQLARIIDRCLEKDPEDRFQSIKDVRRELRGLRKEMEAPIGARAGVAETRSIAVLPFVNMSADSDQEYFSDGLTEELMNVLVKIPDLKVVGRTSSFFFKGKNEDLRTIGEKLTVAHILEGSVRKAGNKIRITAQLVKVSDGFHLWSQTYDRTLDDIFAVQDDIARSVAEELQLTLLGRLTGAQKANAAAHDLVLQARFEIQNKTPENIRRGRRILERALELDPSYALAWAEMGLVHARELEMATSAMERLRANERLRQSYAKALELDPHQTVAQARMAVSLALSWDFAAATRWIDRALAKDPTNPVVTGNAALLYKVVGRLEEAIAFGEKSLEADPLAQINYENLADSYIVAGRLDEAEAMLRKSLDLQPAAANAYQRLGDIHLLRGKAKEAREAYARYVELSGRHDHGLLYYEAVTEHTAGNSPASASAATEFESRFGEVDPLSCARIHAWREEADAAFAWLDKVFAAHDPIMGWMKFDVHLRPLHRDARWEKLLQKIGLPAQ